ncbi:hypothetical protein G3I60_07170 [Streptomyces sp. SID13666]|uniref:cupin domain-containing protein n=1 Tax=unclassified Streptomyces TaxID=2593676 RepID=UPI0013C0941E|nr:MULTISPECIES: hypothetical protein [unclassified Streptomyces]MCZ4097447.1 hypothetical protein [Streptomyces sp. H39-C1]NEA53942.1 hypothetical protein [Streptomyces sp. SID13666]
MTAPSPESAAVPHMLCDVSRLGQDRDAGSKGALWRLDVPERQLDANLVRLPPGERIDWHREPDLDVLLLVTAGEGVADTGQGTLPLVAGVTLWLPHGSARALAAGAGGLTYLTVHRRRPGLRIGARPADAQAGA